MNLTDYKADEIKLLGIQRLVKLKKLLKQISGPPNIVVVSFRGFVSDFEFIICNIPSKSISNSFKSGHKISV